MQWGVELTLVKEAYDPIYDYMGQVYSRLNMEKVLIAVFFKRIYSDSLNES